MPATMMNLGTMKLAQHMFPLLYMHFYASVSISWKLMMGFFLTSLSTETFFPLTHKLFDLKKLISYAHHCEYFVFRDCIVIDWQKIMYRMFFFFLNCLCWKIILSFRPTWWPVQRLSLFSFKMSTYFYNNSLSLF